MSRKHNEAGPSPDCDQSELNDGILVAELVDQSNFITAAKPEPAESSAGLKNDALKISLVEKALSPESLQWLMTIGGGLLAVGFAIWLWSTGVFNEGWIIAIAVGAANIVLLAGGAWLLKKSRYKIAGLGLVMLSCLVMPLNLWLYHSQELIVLGEGGQLWIPALVISILYAAIARLTRNAMFVYALVAGVALTGLLFLAGAPTNLFWAALPTSTFLVALGAVAIQADRWFGEQHGSFSRNHFGLASYRSGFIAVMAGLMVLLGGQILSFAPSFLLEESARSALTQLTVAKGKIWTLAILIGAGYSCVHAMMHDRNSWYARTLGTIVGFWSINQVLYLLDIRLTLDLAILVVGGSIVAFEAWALYTQSRIGAMLEPQDVEKGNLGQITPDPSPAANSVGITSASGLISSCCLFGLFGVSALRSIVALDQSGFLFVNWQHVAQLLLIAVGAAMTPAIWRERKKSTGGSAQAMLALCGLATATALIVAMVHLGFISAGITLVLIALIAASASVGALVFPQLSKGKFLGWFLSGVCGGIASLWGIYLMSNAEGIVWGGITSCVVAALLALAWVAISKKNGGIEWLFGGAASFAMAAQLMTQLGLTGPYVAILTCSSIGWSGVVACRLLGAFQTSPLKEISNSTDRPGSHTGTEVLPISSAFNSIILIGATASVLFATFSLDQSEGMWNQLALLLAQAFGLGVSALLVRAGNWRKSFIAAIPVVLLTSLLVLAVGVEFTFGQLLEFCCVFAGVLVTARAYIGWAAEKDEAKDSTTFTFWLGTTLLVLPMVVGLVVGRLGGGDVFFSWRGVHEIGCLLIGLALLGSGVLCRIRSTTLGGVFLLATVVVSNLLMINWPGELRDASMLMMIGGGAFFSLALLLSIYRDRILEIPKQYREGKGVFSVMKWR